MVARNYNTVTKGLTVTATSGGASSNVVYTCPANHDAEIDFLHITNGASSNHNVSIQWYHADTSTYYHILNDKSIAGKDVYNIITSDRIYLHAVERTYLLRHLQSLGFPDVLQTNHILFP